ncbi:MAG: TonB-dependent receptor [Bacteroidia bacterium]|nr:TonB-dependent receptor [Bacteroidia bacterium]
MDEITVTEKGIKDITGLKYKLIDSTIMKMNQTLLLSGILAEHTSLNIKSFGNGGIATASFRGAGPAHTQVLWNGVNVNSPMLGQVDFSIIPAMFIDEVLVYHGGSSLCNNSGALGGSISILNLPDWNNKLSINATEGIASFNTYNSAFSIGTGNRNFQMKTRLSRGNSANDFSYHEIAGDESSPVHENKNAQFSYDGVIQEFYARIKNDNFITARLWYQQKDQQIPPSILEKQDEDYFRSVVEYKAFGEKTEVTLRSAFLDDYMNYRNFKDSASAINSKNKVITLNECLETNYTPAPGTTFIFGADFDYHQVETNNFDALKHRQNLSLSAGLNKKIGHRISISAFIKQEMTDQNLVPLIPSIGIDYRLLEDYDLILKTNFSRNYHAPTLNDLYWKNDGYSYGNPHLKPEKGCSGEMGIQFRQNPGRIFEWSAELTCYYSLISNWVMWHPDSLGRWFPENIMQVERKGMESTFSLKFNSGRLQTEFQGNYNLTITTNRKSSDINDNSGGKQLPYVPKNTAGGSAECSIKGYFFRYSLGYTGLRYTSSDDEFSLPAYSISNLTAGKKLIFGKSTITTQFVIENLFNTSYQITQGYPMPGRFYRFVVKYEFGK